MSRKSTLVTLPKPEDNNNNKKEQFYQNGRQQQQKVKPRRLRFVEAAQP